MKKSEKELIERIDQLIRLKNTGNANELANKLDVCERTIFNILKRIREEYKAPVSYNEYKNSYVYDVNGRIVLEFQSKILKTSDMDKIKGGKFILLEKNYSLQNSCSSTNYFCCVK